jgi:hypothetical protein
MIEHILLIFWKWNNFHKFSIHSYIACSLTNSCLWLCFCFVILNTTASFLHHKHISCKATTRASSHIVLILHSVVLITFSASWESQKTGHTGIRFRFCSCPSVIPLQLECHWSLATVHTWPTSGQELRQKPPQALYMFWVRHWSLLCIWIKWFLSSMHYL